MTLNGSAFRNAEVRPTLLIIRVSLRIKDTINWEQEQFKNTSGEKKYEFVAFLVKSKRRSELNFKGWVHSSLFEMLNFRCNCRANGSEPMGRLDKHWHPSHGSANCPLRAGTSRACTPASTIKGNLLFAGD